MTRESLLAALRTPASIVHGTARDPHRFECPDVQRGIVAYADGRRHVACCTVCHTLVDLAAHLGDADATL